MKLIILLHFISLKLSLDLRLDQNLRLDLNVCD